MSDLEEINIWWEGPFSFDEIDKNEISEKKYQNKASDVGLYQIYGNHMLYGTDVLLYVGLTYDSFQSRLKNRWVINDSNDINNIKIYLGTIFSHSQNIEKVEKDKIVKAEALIINALKPAFNSSYINSVQHEKYSDFTVYNHNSYKSLLPELSTKRYWRVESLNYTIVESLAKELERYNELDEKDEEFYGFNFDDNEDICFGVDFDYWNNQKEPLVIGIYKKSINKVVLKKHYTDTGEDKEYYFIPACDNLTESDVIDKIKKRLEFVKSLLK